MDDEDLNGYLMYPKVFLDYMGRHRMYGPVRALPTRTFFYGMAPGEEITVTVSAAPDAPVLVLFHGLEGCSQSHYARSIMRGFADAGLAVTEVTICGRTPIRSAADSPSICGQETRPCQPLCQPDPITASGPTACPMP